MESEHVKVSNGHGKKDSEIKHDEEKPLVGKDNTVSSPWSSSSSSSRSSLEFNARGNGSLEDISTKSKSDGHDLSSPEFISSPETSTHSSMSQPNPVGSWQMKSPPIQNMGHPANYDPNRIPSHIFSTKPTTPTEWSVASNESLFSIHMGNNSFSKDNAILLGKSGELPPWLEEWNNNSSPYLHYPSETKASEFSVLPPVMEVPAHEENDVKAVKVEKVLEKEDADKVLPKVPAGANVGNHAKETAAPVEEARPSAAATSPSMPRLSNESGHSASSFAFPVLASDSGKSRSLKSRSLNVITEKQEKSQTQSHGSGAATPTASETRWFSCVFCWPRCC